MANKAITYAEFEKRYGHDALTMLQGYILEMQNKILALPDDQQGLWVYYRTELLKFYKRKYQLEDALDKDKVPPDEIVEANSNIRVLEKRIAEFENLSYQITAADHGGAGRGGIKFPDRGARDGATSIRPSNTTDYKPVAPRQKKV